MNSSPKGVCTWLIPDCYYPKISSPGHYVSHEAVCVLNTGTEDARLRLTVYFEDRAPMEQFTEYCGARRTKHIRLDQIIDLSGSSIPRGVPYALMVESDVPVVIQYSRLDTTQAEMSLMTTMAYPI